MRTSNRFSRYQINVVALLYAADGRLVKLFLFSTLLDTSPLTSIYFATFENKREVRSPLPTQSKFLVFGKFHLFSLYEYVFQLHIMYLVKYKSEDLVRVLVFNSVHSTLHKISFRTSNRCDHLCASHNFL